MHTTSLRRTGAYLASAALLASLTGAIVAAPASAQTPTCDGRPATITDNDGNDADPRIGAIEGTSGNDVIVGTDDGDQIDGLGGNDTICGGRGNDDIDGGGNRDRIFGGSGDDAIFGSGGGDDIFGYTGDDVIIGGRGNDFINGGAGIDDCRQNAGTGRVRDCEKADLRVRVMGPSYLNGTDVVYKVKVTNAGPRAVPYVIELTEADHGVSFCDGQEAWVGFHGFAKLAAGKSRVRKYGLYCEDDLADSWVKLKAEVTHSAYDPKPHNNKASRKTELD